MKSGFSVGVAAGLADVVLGTGFAAGCSSAKMAGAASTIVSRAMRVVFFVTGSLLLEFG